MSFCPECGNKIIKKIVDGVTRHVCDECNFTKWNNPVPVVAALVKHNGKYLIARNTQWAPGIFSLIAGYLESGEDIEEAVVREVKEELNLQGKVTNYLGHYSLIEKNQIILAFEVEATGDLKTNHELAEIKALSAAELSTYDFSYYEMTENIIKVWSNLNVKAAP